MSSFQTVHRLSVSLAHRYWVEAWSEERNRNLFGRSASSEGLGHNMDLELVFRSGVDVATQEKVLKEIKSAWDHTAWFDRKDMKCSSLELMLWDLVQKRGTLFEEILVAESHRLQVSWKASDPKKMALVYHRPLSILWSGPDSGGARLNFKYTFEGVFDPEECVVIARSALEDRLEEKLCHKEALGLEVSKNVKGNQAFLDAMFNDLKGDFPGLVSIACELETQRKWLIHSPILSR